MRLIKTFVRDESGVTAMEYGLMMALISVAIMAALTAIGLNIEVTFTKIATQFSKGSSGP